MSALQQVVLFAGTVPAYLTFGALAVREARRQGVFRRHTFRDGDAVVMAFALLVLWPAVLVFVGLLAFGGWLRS